MALPVIAAATGWIGAFFVGLVTKVAAENALKMAFDVFMWGVKRLFFISLVYVALPLVLYNLFFEIFFGIMEYGINWVISNTAADFSAVVINLSGMGGYIGNLLGIPQCVSMYLTAVSVRFMMGILRIY
jgi:hypothetical protein